MDKRTTTIHKVMCLWDCIQSHIGPKYKQLGKMYLKNTDKRLQSALQYMVRTTTPVRCRIHNKIWHGQMIERYNFHPPYINAWNIMEYVWNVFYVQFFNTEWKIENLSPFLVSRFQLTSSFGFSSFRFFLIFPTDLMHWVLLHLRMLSVLFRSSTKDASHLHCTNRDWG